MEPSRIGEGAGALHGGVTPARARRPGGVGPLRPPPPAGARRRGVRGGVPVARVRRTGSRCRQRGTRLRRSFVAEASCKLGHPGDVAVEKATGDAYVYDRGNNFVDRIGPKGECLGRFKVSPATSGEPAHEGIAFDNSGSGPSAGDLYVVTGKEEHAVVKFKPTGSTAIKLGEIQAFEVEGLAEELEEIHGIGVDASGGLWVYNRTQIDHFDSGQPNKYVSEVAVGLECEARAGFAVAPAGNAFYVGAFRENALAECEESTTVIVKLGPEGEPATQFPGGPPRLAQLDNERNSGVTVDESSGEVYLDNGTSVSAFTASGKFVQRFGGEQLQKGTGVAVDEASGEVYVADLHEAQFDVYAPQASPPPPPSPEAAEPTLADGRTWELVTPPDKLGRPSTRSPCRTVSCRRPPTEVRSRTRPRLRSCRRRRPTTRRNRRCRSRGTGPAVEHRRPHHPPSRPDAARRGSRRRHRVPLLLQRPRDGGARTDRRSPGHRKPQRTAARTGSDRNHLYSRTLGRSSAECEPIPSTCYTPLVYPGNEPTGTPFGDRMFFLTSTPDAQHVVLKSEVRLLPGVADEGLYEYAGGKLSFLSALPEVEKIEVEEPIVGGPAEAEGGNTRNAISSDGSRSVLVRAATDRGGGSVHARRPAREDAAHRPAHGVKASETENAIFQTASADGSRVFFTDAARLTSNATEVEPEPESEGNGDLYVCEVIETEGSLSCNLTDLTTTVRAKGEARSPRA